LPTNINASVVCHLSHTPELKYGANERPYCKVSGWTADSIKQKDGERKKEFTSIEGLVGGKPAEWLARDCKKGSMVLLTGKARVRAYTNKEGQAKGVLDFLEITTAMCLDAKEEGQDAAPAAAPQKKAAPADDGESAPF